MQPFHRRPKRPPRAQGQPGKEPRDILRVQPVERAPQAVVVEVLSANPWPQQMLYWLVGKELGHQIQLPVTEPQSVEHEGHRGRAHAHLLTLPRRLLVQPGRYSDLSAHFGHDPQMACFRFLLIPLPALGGPTRKLTPPWSNCGMRVRPHLFRVWQ
jgi:hypothetical protein